MEHIVQLIESSVASIKSLQRKDKDCAMSQKESMASRDSRGMGINSVEGSVSRIDANVFILAILYRILHRLLSFDPLFAKWQVSAEYCLDLPHGGLGLGSPQTPLEEESPQRSNFNSRVEASLTFPPRPTRGHMEAAKAKADPYPPPSKIHIPVEHTAPHGIVLTCINLSTFIQDCLDVVSHVSSLNETSSCGLNGGPKGDPSSIVGAGPVQALAENSLSLVLGLLTSSDNGLGLLMSITDDDNEEGGGSSSGDDGHGLGESQDIINKGNINFEDIEMKKKSPNIETWIRSVCLNNVNSSVRRGACQVLFSGCANIHYLYTKSLYDTIEDERRDRQAGSIIPSSSSFSSSNHPPSPSPSPLPYSEGSYKSEGDLKDSRLMLLNYLCAAITNSARPSYSKGEGGGGDKGDALGATAVLNVDSDDQRAEHVYTLVASLTALRVSPSLIYPSSPSPPSPEQVEDSPTNSFSISKTENSIMRDADISDLCDVYASQLMTHR